MASSSLVKASGKTLVTTIGMTLVGFLSSVITARVLGPEGRGLLSAALLIGTLSASIAQFGLANSFVYHAGARRKFNYLRLLIVSLVSVTATAMLLAWLGLQLSTEARLHEQLFLILCFAAFLASQNYFFSLSQLHADLNFFNFMRFGLVFGNTALLLLLLILFHPVEFQQILFVQGLVVIILTVLGLGWARRNRVWQANSEGEAVRWRHIGQYGLNQHGTVLIGIALVNFDKIVLLRMGTIEQYGFYALAFTTSRLIGALQEAVSTALYARFAGKDVHDLGEKVKLGFRLTLFPMLLIAAIGAALSPWLIVWVYGKAFAAMTLTFCILLFECVLGGASWTLAQRFNAGGRPGLVLIRQMVSVFPVFAVVPFLPQENIYVSLAILMLCAAVIRLIVTLALYPLSLKEPIPRLIPTLQDIKKMKQLLYKKNA